MAAVRPDLAAGHKPFSGQPGAIVRAVIEATEPPNPLAVAPAMSPALATIIRRAMHPRRERFAPISERAIANWRELRQGSAIDLHDITLKKSGRTGRADFDVRADELRQCVELGICTGAGTRRLVAIV